MKIAVYQNLAPGGAKRVVYEEIKYLSKRHKVDLYQLSSADNSYLDLRRMVSEYYEYEFSIKSSLPSVFSRFDRDFQNYVLLNILEKRIAGNIDQRHYDAVLVHPDRFTQSPFVLKHLKTPCVYYCEELLRIAYEKELDFKDNVGLFNQIYESVSRLIRKTIDRKNAEHAGLIMANSGFTKINIEKYYQKDAITCYPGVDIDIFKPFKTKRNYVLAVEGRSFIHGFDLLEAIEKLLKNKIKVVHLDSYAKNHRFISDGAMADLYAKAVATICISRNEPFGLTAIESMACGTPVLAVNEGGYKETVKDKETGFLLNRNAKEFADNIFLLNDNPVLAHNMGLEGRRRAIKYFNWEKHNRIVEQSLLSPAINK